MAFVSNGSIIIKSNEYLIGLHVCFKGGICGVGARADGLKCRLKKLLGTDDLAG